VKQQKPTDYRVPGALRKPKTALGVAAAAATAKRLAKAQTPPDELERIRMERARKRNEARDQQLARAHDSRVLTTWFLQAPGWECDIQLPRACEPYGTGTSRGCATPEKAVSGLEQVGVARDGIGTGNIKDVSV
jgi:hypothetical protein